MGRWPRIVALGVVGLLATLALAGAASVGPTAPAPTPQDGYHAESQQVDGVAAQTEEFESLQLRLRVLASGDVVWTYRYIYPVESDEDRAAFQDYAERFESEETELYRDFRNQSASLTASAAERLGREMTATDYQRAARIDTTPTREVGEVELSYRWTNFGRVEADAVRVGDVFEGGFYLDSGQSLVFVASENLTFETVAPEGTASSAPVEDRRTVTWTGEQRFPDEHPRATLSIQNAAGQTEGTDGGMSGPIVLGGGILLLVLALLAIAVARDDLPELRGLGEGWGASDAVATPEPISERVPDESDAEIDSQTDPDSSSTDAATESEPLSDDQRVRSLLEEHDGRMKQSAIVDETEWSKSKVSMLLSEMEDEETISKIQVGRENIIALRGSEPEAANSPFDESE